MRVGSPWSVMSTCAAVSGATRTMPEVDHLLESASRVTRRAERIMARLIWAMSRFVSVTP
nr:hypothetical protein [Verrucomicrobium spinosum]